MLLIVGEVRDVEDREVRPKNGGAPFNVTTVHVLEKRTITRVDLAGREYYRGAVPVAGENVALAVSVRAYPRAGGQEAGFGLVAWENLSADVKVAEGALS